MGAGSGEMRLKLKTINQARKLRGVERGHAGAEESRREQSAEMDKRGRKLERVRKSVARVKRGKRERERERERRQETSEIRISA